VSNDLLPMTGDIPWVPRNEDGTFAGACFAPFHRDIVTIGLVPGDLVLLRYANCYTALNLFFYCIRQGWVPCFIPPDLPSQRVRTLALAFGAKVLFTAHLPPQLAEVGAQVVETPLCLVLVFEAGPRLTRAGEVVVTTSGTSGSESACVLGFESMLLNARRHARAVGLQQQDRVLVLLPIHYSYGLVAQVLAAVECGAGLMLGTPSIGKLVNIVPEGTTCLSLTPFLLRRLLADSAEPFPSSLRILTIGGDFTPPGQVVDLRRRYPKLGIYLTYGLTEAGPRVSTLAAHIEPPSRYGSVGLPLEGTRVRLSGAEDALPAGELLVYSDTLMRRHLGAPRPSPWTPKGELRTGDLFEFVEGYMYWRGRLSDIVVRGGEKVNLASIGRDALRVPGVSYARAAMVNGELQLELQCVTPPRDLKRQLSRLLRPVERPDRVIVTGHRRGYK